MKKPVLIVTAVLIVLALYFVGLVVVAASPAGTPAPTAAPASAAPKGCGPAHSRMAEHLVAARDALKAVLKGERRAGPRAALERANLALWQDGAPEVTAALLDCGSADAATATAYRDARDAVRGASIAANLIGEADLMPPALAQLEGDLTSIENALDQI